MSGMKHHRTIIHLVTMVHGLMRMLKARKIQVMVPAEARKLNREQW